MTEQQADADRRFGPRATAVIREWTGAYPAEDRDQPMTNHDRMNYWWRRATQADAELDSWMTRAYEAEGKLWKAEARIRHLEATAQVLVKEALDAENARNYATAAAKWEDTAATYDRLASEETPDA